MITVVKRHIVRQVDGAYPCCLLVEVELQWDQFITQNGTCRVVGENVNK